MIRYWECGECGSQITQAGSVETWNHVHGDAPEWCCERPMTLVREVS